MSTHRPAPSCPVVPSSSSPPLALPSIRSYPTATVVGGEVWLVGGGDTGDVIADVLVFTPATRRWRRPALTGELYLLQRTAHGACLHPQRPDCILLQGGYGRTPCEDELW